MSFSNGNSNQTSEINVTPLIDVLLVLLIIFMVLTPLKQLGLKAVTPQPAAQNASSIPAPTTVVFQVHSGVGGGAPTYSINQQPVAKRDIVSRLAAIYVNRSERVMFLKGDAGLEFSSIAEVIGMGRQAQVTDIAVLTPKTERGE